MKENYRSSAAILRAARKVINENPGGDRELLPHNGEGAPVRIVHAESPVSEAIFAAREISRQVGGIDMLDAHQKAEERRFRSFSEIAVLYRTHRQAELLEFALKKEGIPYIVAWREDFLKNSLVQGTLGFLQFLRHPEDETAKQICLEALWELGKDELSEAVLLQASEKFGRQKKKKPAKLIGEWIEEIQAGQEESMKKLQNMAAFYGNMDEFLDALRLGVESDLKRTGGKAYTADMATLMTMHGAKGLEFPAVILVGAQKGLVPYESGKHPADQEEAVQMSLFDLM